MFAALKNPAVRKKTGVSLKVAKEFTDADPGGKLPKRVTKKKRRKGR